MKEFGTTESKDPDHLIGFAENHKKNIIKNPLYQINGQSGYPDSPPDPRIYDFKLQEQISKVSKKEVELKQNSLN